MKINDKIVMTLLFHQLDESVCLHHCQYRFKGFAQFWPQKILMYDQFQDLLLSTAQLQNKCSRYQTACESVPPKIRHKNISPSNKIFSGS